MSMLHGDGCSRERSNKNRRESLSIGKTLRRRTISSTSRDQRREKKGHRKPIRRLAMTSILKQNTMCFALPLCRRYRQGRRAVSIANGSSGYLEKYSIGGRENMMVVADLSTSNMIRYRGGAAARLVAGPPTGPTTSNSLGILPSRSNCVCE